MLSFTIGLLIPYAGRDALSRTEGKVAFQLMLEVVAFQALVFCPVGLYLYATEPAWSWNYFMDPAGSSHWLGWVGIAAYLLLGLIAASVGVLLARRGHFRPLAGLLALGLLAQLVFFLVYFSRFFWVGSFEAFQSYPEATGLVAFPKARLGLALSVIAPTFLVILAWMTLRWRRFGRRLRLSESGLRPLEPEERASVSRLVVRPETRSTG